MGVSRLAALVFAAACLTSVTACDPFAERSPDVEHPQRFGEADLALDYPGNWKVSTERETVEQFSIHTHHFEPKWGNSMVMVQVFTPGLPVDYDQLLTDFRTGMKESMAGSLIEARTIDGQPQVPAHHELLGEQREGRRMKFAIGMLGETVENTVEVYVAELDDRTLIVYTQAPDEDLATARPAFEQILGSISVGG